MINSIIFYRKKGWQVTVNNNNQVVFTDPETDKYFTLTNATKKEREFVENTFVRSFYGTRLRTRFIHRREQS